MHQLNLRNDRINLLVASALSLIAWVTPVISYVMIPIQYLNTHIHELSHAIAGVATGASVGPMYVYANGSGVTSIGGGFAMIFSPAGYIGATIVGAAMLFCARSAEFARTCLRVLATIMAIGLVVWLKGEFMGFLSAALWIGTFWLAAAKLSDKGVALFLSFLGVQQCFTSILSVFQLVGISATSSTHSDAKNMEMWTRVPAIVWAVAWAGISFGVLVFALRHICWPKRS